MFEEVPEVEAADENPAPPIPVPEYKLLLNSVLY
jgi:hypothetical protein